MKRMLFFTALALLAFSCKKDDDDKDPVVENPIATEGAGVYDIDSNFYKSTVIVNSGEWMSQNLKACHYKTGDTILSGRNLDDISGMSQPKFFFYANGDSSANLNKYGRLYTYYVVEDPRGLCPTGWHVPTQSEWDTLSYYLGGQEVAGGKLKASDFWQSPNDGADNSTLFSALPAGFRTPEEVYEEVTKTSIFWTASPTDTKYWSYYIKYNYPTLFRVPSEGNQAYSVRCKRD